MSYFNRYRQTALVIALIVIGVIAMLPFLPISQTKTFREFDTDVTMTINRRFVHFPWNCVQYEWNAENIREIYFRETGVTGSDARQYCEFDVVNPVLKVLFSNNQFGFYQLNPTILSNSLAVQVTLLLAALLILYALVPPGIALPIARAVEVTGVMLLITFLLLEVGIRVYISTNGSRYERLVYLGSPEEIAQANQHTLPTPYVNYILNPLVDGVDQMGFRGEDITLEKPEGTFRIVTLGGSTTYGGDLSTPEQTWPYQLEQTLRNDYGYEHVEVINAALSAYKVMNSLVNLQTRVVELDPDMVIVYHAVNDSLTAQLPRDCYRGENILLGIGVSASFNYANNDLGPSAFLRFAGLKLGIIPDPAITTYDFNFAESPLVACNTFEQVPAEDPTRYFARDYRNLIVIAQTNGITPLVSTWTYNKTSDYVPPYVDDFNDVIRELAATYEVPFYDLDAELEHEADYWTGDNIHQSFAGMQAQAAHYAAYLDEAGLIHTSN